jgi:hypothetical protein
MRYSLHLEPEETKALFALTERFVTLLIGSRVAAVAEVEPREASASPTASGDKALDAEALRAETNAKEAQAKSDKAKALHGRDLWLALIDMWRQGFGLDEAPQPDRVAVLLRILRVDGGAVFAYLRSRAGLTDATRDVLSEILQRPLDAEAKRAARLLAENIAQVSSFYAPDLTERLEYTAEFHNIEDY